MGTLYFTTKLLARLTQISDFLLLGEPLNSYMQDIICSSMVILALQHDYLGIEPFLLAQVTYGLFEGVWSLWLIPVIKRKICKKLGSDCVTLHDLRLTLHTAMESHLTSDLDHCHPNNLR